MTLRVFGVVTVVLLTTTLAGCAGEKRSAGELNSLNHQLRVQEHKAERAALLKAKAEARRRSGHGPSIPPILVAGAEHPDAARIALQYLGVPYVWGGSTPRGFDASGLVKYVYSQLGIKLPHYTVSQWNVTAPISRAKMKPGDLVFFDGLGHVGIYIGDGQFVHAPHTGAVTRIESLPARGSSFDGARRVP